MKVFLQREVQEILRGVNERNNCGRMSIYMQQVANDLGLSGYFADVEYNRMQNGSVKTILDGDMKVVSINCDLLLHSRGQLLDADNLIAVEVKKRNAPDDEKEKDKERLRALTKASYDDIWSADGGTNPEHVCGYILGVYVELDRRNRTCLCEYYKAGEKFEEITCKF